MRLRSTLQLLVLPALAVAGTSCNQGSGQSHHSLFALPAACSASAKAKLTATPGSGPPGAVLRLRLHLHPAQADDVVSDSSSTLAASRKGRWQALWLLKMSNDRSALGDVRPGGTTTLPATSDLSLLVRLPEVARGKYVIEWSSRLRRNVEGLEAGPHTFCTIVEVL